MIDNTIKNNLLLRAARGEQTERTPVWLMRQAGRFDPEYLALRDRHELPLEDLFCQPDLAAEITFLPKRLGVDALILFQDILTPLTPMGAPFIFRPGPLLESPIRTGRDIRRLRVIDPDEELAFVAESIRLVKSSLADEIPLLGFAGAPLTLAAFMIEGRSPGSELNHTRSLMQDRPELMRQLLGKLASVTTAYLRMQIEAGVDALQIFESISDLLTEQEYETFAHPYHRQIFSMLKDTVPRILFAKEQPRMDLMIQSGADVLSIGKCIDIADAKTRYNRDIAWQGNVDNHLLMNGTFDEIDEAVRRCIIAGAHKGHILNLNHGLLKDTPFDNVCRLIDTCRTTRLNVA